VELPDGVTFEQYVLRIPKAAMMAVLDDQNRVLMMWRHRGARGRGRDRLAAATLNYRGMMLTWRGEGEHAERLLREAVVLSDQLGASFYLMWSLRGLVSNSMLSGQTHRAVRLAGARRSPTSARTPPTRSSRKGVA
jgi:hypothetical protein